MADRIEPKDVLSPKVEKSFEELNKEMLKSIKILTDLTKTAISMFQAFKPETIRDVTTSQKGYNVANQESQKVVKQGISIQEKYNQKIAQVTKEEERLKLALQNKRKAIKDSIKAEKAQAGSINNLNAKNKILRERIRNVSAETVSGRKRIIAYNRAIDRNSRAVEKASDAATRQAKGIGRYKDAVKGLGAQLGLVTGGIALVAAAIRKAGQVIKQAIEVNREFEKTFTNVLTLLDKAQKEEFGVRLEKGSIDIVAKYGLAIGNVNKSLFDAISAGVPAGKAIQFLDKSAKLATAGNAELSSVVDGATNVMNAYGEKAGDTDEILNAFFATQVKGKTDVGLLATNIGKVASTAAAADIPINELFGTFAGLTKFIGSTEESATALAAVMNAIIKPADKAKSTFKSLGIETGITAIKNNGLLNTLLQVANAYEENGDVLAELIPNIRAFKGVAGLSADAIAEIEMNITDLNDAEKASMLVQEAFNEQMSTGANQAERMAGSWKRLLVTVGGGESIFKKIGSSIRKHVTKEIDIVTVGVEVLRITWQNLTRQLSAEEAFDAIKEVRNRFSGLNEEIKTSAEVTEDNAEVTEKATETVNIQITSIESLRTKVSELQKAKSLLSETDLKGIETKNIEIKAIQDQIKALNELGIKEEEVIEIKEKNNEDILELIQKQDEKELELLEEKLQNESDAILGIEEEKLVSLEDLRMQEINSAQKADMAKKESFRGYVDFAVSQAQTLSNSIISFKQNELSNEQAFAIEKAKARGASEEEIIAIEKKYAKKRQNIAITQATINTALGVTSALANPGGILGIILAAVVLAAGIIEIASIKSQKFAKGTHDSGPTGQVAWVGEQGTERVNLTSGESFLTPNKATKMYLPPHSEVVPNNQLQRDLAELQMIGGKSVQKEDEYRRKKEHKELINAIKNRDETSINITENGFHVIAKKGSDFTKYIDKKYRS